MLHPHPPTHTHTHTHCGPQDALHKEASIKHQSQRAARALEKSSPALLSEHQVSLKYLQAVAGVRFGLSVAAEQLKNGHVDERLLRATYELCIDRRVNVVDSVDTTGPLLYLVKLLIRQFGYPCLEAVCKVYPWILPEELKKSDTVKIKCRECLTSVNYYDLPFRKRRKYLILS